MSATTLANPRSHLRPMSGRPAAPGIISSKELSSTCQRYNVRLSVKGKRHPCKLPCYQITIPSTSRARAPLGGLSAFIYFFTVSLCMPSPGRSHEWTAHCAAPSVPPSISLSKVVWASADEESQSCELFQCHSRRTCQGSFRHRVWRPSLQPLFFTQLTSSPMSLFLPHLRQLLP